MKNNKNIIKNNNNITKNNKNIIKLNNNNNNNNNDNNNNANNNNNDNNNNNKKEINNSNKQSENNKNNNNNDKKNNKDKKEIFIRNIGFNTTEESLKNLFTQYVPENSINFCLLVRDKETNNSKGSAFIELSPSSYNKIMLMYNDYNSKNKLNKDEMNPFELEGRNLKLFEAKTRDEIKEIKENNNKKQSKRSKEYLYYGLSKESLNNCKLNEEITEEDKNKREKLIQIKKDNYYNNPNYHVSNTRLSFRNFEKNINEENIKKIIFDVLNGNKEFNKNYKNVKMIKQIKLLKEENDKSKCVAFVECKDLNIGKFLIDNLSGFKFHEKSKKGLIIDFVLDDYRKKLSRERKLERIKEIKRERKKELKLNKNNNNNNNNKVELNSINDINKLIDLYHTTLSRGKKQRIKKKLKNLGYTKNIPPLKLKKNINKNNNNIINNNINKDEYESIKIVNNKTDLNKK